MDDYLESVSFLSEYLTSGQLVLDYGCGVGGFLMACKKYGLVPVGVDFDRDAALAAGRLAGCDAMSVDEFEGLKPTSPYQVIHLGDVLEHLPDPLTTLSQLAERLPEGALLYVEGPLETNPSPVYWAALIFGSLKRVFKPNFIAERPPTHLLRTDAGSQKLFFSRIPVDLALKAWQVTETGWPYANGGLVKRSIAKVARMLGGRHVMGRVFGNRFRAILVRRPSVAQPNIEASS